MHPFMQGSAPPYWEHQKDNIEKEDLALRIEPIKKKEPTFEERQNMYMQGQHPGLVAPMDRNIDLATEYDAVNVKWVGSSSSSAMSGTIEIKKLAIQDKQLIEWVENRELYHIWESEQKKTRKAAPKRKLADGEKPQKPKTATKKKKDPAEQKKAKERNKTQEFTGGNAETN